MHKTARGWLLGASFSIGASIAGMGLYGDSNSWWNNEPFTTNILSSLSTALMGLPFAIILVSTITQERAAEIQAHRLREHLIALSIEYNSEIEANCPTSQISELIDLLATLSRPEPQDKYGDLRKHGKEARGRIEAETRAWRKSQTKASERFPQLWQETFQDHGERRPDLAYLRTNLLGLVYQLDEVGQQYRALRMDWPALIHLPGIAAEIRLLTTDDAASNRMHREILGGVDLQVIEPAFLGTVQQELQTINTWGERIQQLERWLKAQPSQRKISLKAIRG